MTVLVGRNVAFPQSLKMNFKEGNSGESLEHGDKSITENSLDIKRVGVLQGLAAT